MKIKTKGQCTYCGGTISKTKSSIITHQKKCPDMTSMSKGDEDFHLLLIEDAYGAGYWLVVKIKSSSTLKQLDSFLRNIWVECCRHKSQFFINRETIGMSRPLEDTFGMGAIFNYVYDFGSETGLKIKVLDIVEAPAKEKITILARNEPPEYECSECDNLATCCCAFCHEDALLCDECASEHKCVQDEGEDALMPIVNSPRFGVCGYEGYEDKRVKKYFPKDIIQP